MTAEQLAIIFDHFNENLSIIAARLEAIEERQAKTSEALLRLTNFISAVETIYERREYGRCLN
jgi:hypothetical protein